jgi:hypothetical protein
MQKTTCGAAHATTRVLGWADQRQWVTQLTHHKRDSGNRAIEARRMALGGRSASHEALADHDEVSLGAAVQRL